MSRDLNVERTFGRFTLTAAVDSSTWSDGATVYTIEERAAGAMPDAEPSCAVEVDRKTFLAVLALLSAK